MELYHIRDINDTLTHLIKDDPVRPHIPLEQRVSDLSEILVLKSGDEILAATCMQWLTEVPETEQDLISMGKDRNVAVFYTIWSYSPGAGSSLLQKATDWLKSEFETLTGIVTLSPPTAMAQRFHLKNGARIRKTNKDTVNYEYYFKE